MGEGAGPDQAAAERRFRFELAAHPGSPAQARRLARARLTGWSVCEDTCDTALLVISELVTNAIVHTASDIVVCELLDGDDVVRIAVRDQGCSPDDPHPSPQRPEEEHGRGLLLVEALCQSWGAQEHGSGLLVWADLPRGADAPTAAAEPAEAGDSVSADPVRDPAEPRDDLGWGARPKPGTADGSGDEDESEEQSLRAGLSGTPAPRVGHQHDRTAGAETRATSPAPSHGATEAYAAELIRPASHDALETDPRRPARTARPTPQDAPEPGTHAGHPTRPAPEPGIRSPQVVPQRNHGPEHLGRDRADQHPPQRHAPDHDGAAASPAARHRDTAHHPQGTADRDQHAPQSHAPQSHAPERQGPSPRVPDPRTLGALGPDHRAFNPFGPDRRSPGQHVPDLCVLDHHGPSHHALDHTPFTHAPLGHAPLNQRTPDHRTPDHRALDHHVPDQLGTEHRIPAHQVPGHSPAPAGEAPAPRPFPGGGAGPGGTGLPALERSRERGRA